jgi:hypothetical protein
VIYFPVTLINVTLHSQTRDRHSLVNTQKGALARIALIPGRDVILTLLVVCLTVRFRHNQVSHPSSLASCVEQDVSCSRMPKSIAHHHTSIPSYSDSRPGLPYLNSTAPNFSGHRRNISGSDWSSDSSSRSRSSQYSQPATGEFGFDGTTLDSLPVPRGLPAPSGLPLPWAPGTPGNQNLDQSTITPNQVRALYGGSLPAGYTHPSQFPPMAGGINLPNPASLTSSNAPDPYNSFNPTMSYGSTQRSSTRYALLWRFLLSAQSSFCGFVVQGLGSQPLALPAL